MCIQMTQVTILEAKKEGRAVKDGEFSYSLCECLFYRSYEVWRYERQNI